MSIGFRPTPEDSDIIQAHKRPDESTADVLRRALRALDRDRWEQQAREDMDRIAASGEDLSDEPDDWGYDDAGRVVDLRGSAPAPAERVGSAAPREQDAGEREPDVTWLIDRGAVDRGAPRIGPQDAPLRFGPPVLKAVRSAQGPPPVRPRTWSASTLSAAVEDMVNYGAEVRAAARRPSPGPRGFECAIELDGLSLAASAAAAHMAVEPSRPTPPKLARLRAAARRARQR